MLLQDRYLPLDFRGSSFPEMSALLSADWGLGIDGVFVDCPETASMWLSLWCATEGLETCFNSPLRRLDPRGDEPSHVHPATAVSVFVVVGMLIAACVVWVALRRKKAGYKAYRGVGLQADSATLYDGEVMRVGTELAARASSQHGGSSGVRS